MSILKVRRTKMKIYYSNSKWASIEVDEDDIGDDIYRVVNHVTGISKRCLDWEAAKKYRSELANRYQNSPANF